jgi:hypothetical protein
MVSDVTTLAPESPQFRPMPMVEMRTVDRDEPSANRKPRPQTTKILEDAGRLIAGGMNGKPSAC